MIIKTLKWTLSRAMPSLSFMLLYTLIGFIIGAYLFIPQIEEAMLDPRCNNPSHFSAPELRDEDGYEDFWLPL